MISSEPLLKHTKPVLLLASLLLVAAIGFIDSLTGPELSLSALYLIPIGIASYSLGFAAGFWISLFSIFAYLISDHILSITYSESATPYWNAGLRALFFFAVAFALHKHRTAQDNLAKSREQFRIFAKLHEIDRCILSALSSQEVAGESIQQLQTIVPFDVATVVIFDLEAYQGTMLSIHPHEELNKRDRTFVLDEFEVRKFLNKESFSVLDENPDQRTLVSECLPVKEIRSYLSIPLLSAGKPLGAMTLGKKAKMPFSDTDIQISKEVAKQAALALNSSILLEEITSAHQRLQLISHRLITLQESEKHHLARELHDELGQSLTALRIHLDEVHGSVRNQEIRARLIESSNLVERILDQVRNLSIDLRPLILDDLGLQAALRWYVSRKAQLAGFAVHFESNLISKLPTELETACFRIAQEAVTNSMRHAKAKKLHVSLTGYEDSVELLIKDDGIGFRLESAKEKALLGQGFGLLGIRERVKLLNGDVEIESFPSCGTQVFVRLPLNAVHGTTL